LALRPKNRFGKANLNRDRDVAPALNSSPTLAATKKLREDIAKVKLGSLTAARKAAKIKPAKAARSRSSRTKRVILLALLLISERLIRLIDLLKLGLVTPFFVRKTPPVRAGLILQ
jgi:hypothetical protein